MSGFSRRSLIGQGAALAFAPVAARAATGTHIAPPPLPLPQTENIQGTADSQNRLTVDTYINEKGPFSFVVDTGADRSVIADDLAKSLGLRPSDDVIVQGIARALPASAVQLDNLRIGRVRIDSLPMPVLPRSWLGADGYLGLDVIDRQEVTFDFQNHKLSIEPSDLDRKFLAVADGALVRVNGSDGKLTAVNCSVDGVKAYVFVDSGAEISIGNSNLFRALQQNGGKYLNDEVVQLLGVTGGSAAGRLTFVERIKLGSISFMNSVLVISDLQVFDVWNLADKPALFLGMNFLRQTSSVTVDYGRKELRFKLADLRIASRA
ncbi:MAG TPA: aspartyl protease family protein [Rhizomicrobium sp.]|nr:aspartyl protease family protein [Rhizomicrobium sp.]